MPTGTCTPSTTLREPGKCAAGDELAGASAMRWLLAEEPRLRIAGQVPLMPKSWLTARLVVLEEVGDPGPASSRRRIQAQLIRRSPSSMPLVQLTP